MAGDSVQPRTVALLCASIMLRKAAQDGEVIMGKSEVAALGQALMGADVPAIMTPEAARVLAGVFSGLAAQTDVMNQLREIVL